MANQTRPKFTVITNENYENNLEHNNVTNPLKQVNPYQEKLLRFVNQEGGKKFTVRDLLKW